MRVIAPKHIKYVWGITAIVTLVRSDIEFRYDRFIHPSWFLFSTHFFQLIKNSGALFAPVCYYSLSALTEMRVTFVPSLVVRLLIE